MDNSVGFLAEQIRNAKSSLTSINENINRIFGHNATLRNDNPPAAELRVPDSGYDKKNEEIRNSKRRHSDIKRLSNRIATQSGPRISSRVIRELPSRQEIVAAQGIDTESKARNKRIFNSLLSTLHKFCQEESLLKEKEEKKTRIEKRLEAQEERERKKLRKEREMLFIERKHKQLEIKLLETKLNRLKDYEAWKSSFDFFKQNIRTKTKPHIFFRPRTMDKKTEKLLTASRADMDALKRNKLKNINEDISELEKQLELQLKSDMEKSGENLIEDRKNKNIIFDNVQLAIISNTPAEPELALEDFVMKNEVKVEVLK